MKFSTTRKSFLNFLQENIFLKWQNMLTVALIHIVIRIN